MSKYRFKYEKGEQAKYISHLDFIRCMGRTFRRAGLPIKYSQGFNPHPVMTVGLPISVGVTGDCEYADIAFCQDMDLIDMVRAFNNNLPLGLKIKEAKKIDEFDKPLSDIAEAEYEVSFYLKDENALDIEKFLSTDEIIVEKKTKKGMKDTNIRPDILSIKKVCSDGKVKLCMLLSAGANGNLKPDLVISAMEKYLDGFVAYDVSIHRKCLYFKNQTSIM